MPHAPCLTDCLSAPQTPDDQYLSKQWHLDKVQAMDAWNYSTGGTVKVCVLKGGVTGGEASWTPPIHPATQ